MLFEVGCGDDFDDEVYFKRGRVVTPRFPDINFTVLIIKLYSFIRFYRVIIISLFISLRVINFICIFKIIKEKLNNGDPRDFVYFL